MNKQDFLTKLEKGLSVLPQEDISDRLNFYSEMIADRMEEGLSEEAAVLEIGDVQNIISQIIADTPITKLIKETAKPKRALFWWEIVLLILGSPLWLTVLLAVVAIIISVYVSLWSIIISLWAIFVALLGIALGGILWGGSSVFLGNTLVGAAIIGAGLFCAGFSIFMFYGCKFTTRGILCSTKKIVLGIKNSFVKKEAT